jgi:hypothetical protein
MTTFRDREMNAATKTEHAALLRAAMQTGRTLAGGVTHDLNSALQILGDSLYSIKDDTRTLIRAAQATGEAQKNLASSLELADEAFDRIRTITRVVPNLVVGSAEDAGPILVEAELRAIVALTRHHWRNRLNVVVDVPPPIPQFWCKWWIARLAAMRMMMLAGESQTCAPSNANRELLPTLMITGAMNADWFELGVSVERSAGEPIVSPTDSVMTLCAKSLGGEIDWSVTPSGGSFVSLCYPVRLVPTPSVARYA